MPKTISIANGSYPELNILRKVSNLTITGESRDGVVVGDVNFESLNSGSCGSNPPSWAGTADGGATDAVGWREFGSMDPSGAPLDVSARLGVASVKVNGVATNLALARQLGSAAGLTTRAEIFQNSTIATGAPGGWAPAP